MNKIILAALLIVVVLLTVLPSGRHDSTDNVQTDIIYVIGQSEHLIVLVTSLRQKQNNILGILRKVLSTLVFSMAIVGFLFHRDKQCRQSMSEHGAWNMPEWLSSLLALIET